MSRVEIVALERDDMWLVIHDMPTSYRGKESLMAHQLGEDIDLDVEDVRLKNGTRLTNKRAEQIAEDVLRRRRGRPSLTGDAQTSPRVSFRIPEQLRRIADERARREGRTVSDLAREALEHFLAE